ncbi:MAG: Holliday junction branch migration protein RuvA [Bacteroidales bacterium]
MISFIEGNLEEKNPAYLVINCHGVGYQIHISLHTYSQIPDSGFVRLHTFQVIREDAHQLFGFSGKPERELFRHLISVSGVGPNTARMILSSMSPDEIKLAIVNNNLSVLQSIKGIGAKSAQRIIVDLKDRLEKEGILQDENLIMSDNTIHEEALSALVMLGFAKNSAQKTLTAILKRKQGTAVSVEELVKEALKSF